MNYSKMEVKPTNFILRYRHILSPNDIITKLTLTNYIITQDNGLKSLPNNWKNLLNLKELFLTKNQFENESQLFKSLTQLEQLQVLDLSRNNLKSITNDIGKITSLKCLDLSQNCLRSLPQCLGKKNRL